MQNSLSHVGILGMKWGRRKGPDTSSSDHKTAKVLKKKKLSELSNDELKKLTTRLSLEKQYNDLTKTSLSRGKAVIGGLLENAGKQLVTKVIVDGVTSGSKTLMELLLQKRG